MKITLTKEEKELMKPSVEARRLAEYGVKTAISHDKASSDSLFALLKSLFPGLRILSFDHPTNGDWTVTAIDENDPRIKDYDRYLDEKRLIDPMKDLKRLKSDDDTVEDDPELKLEPTIKEEDPDD